MRCVPWPRMFIFCLILCTAQPAVMRSTIHKLDVPGGVIESIQEAGISTWERVNLQDLSRRPATDPTKFLYATISGNLDHVRAYLTAGGDPNIVGENKVTGLMCAARKGHCLIVKQLLDRTDVNVLQKDVHGFNAADYARQSNSDTILKLLERHGCHACPPITLENLAAIETYLLTNNDPDVVDSAGETALMQAVIFERLDIIEGLLACKIDINEKSRSGETALSVAVGHGNFNQIPNKRIIELLLQYGACIHTTDARGETLIHTLLRYTRGEYYRASQAFIAILMFLLKSGAPVKLGTKLTEAFMLTQPEGVREILEAAHKAETAREVSWLELQKLLNESARDETCFLSKLSGSDLVNKLNNFLHYDKPPFCCAPWKIKEEVIEEKQPHKSSCMFGFQ